MFPSSKAQLITDQGWKVMDLTADKRVHLADVLDKIPERTYRSLEDIALRGGGSRLSCENIFLGTAGWSYKEWKAIFTRKEADRANSGLIQGVSGLLR